MEHTDRTHRSRARTASACALACSAFIAWRWIDEHSAERLPLGTGVALGALLTAGLLIAGSTVLALRHTHLRTRRRRAFTSAFIPVAAWMEMSGLRLLVDPTDDSSDGLVGAALLGITACMFVAVRCICRVPAPPRTERPAEPTTGGN
ncbi:MULTISPECIES: hypothetical protein [Kitasatospora]|nr:MULTISPECIES: hypothetical protein [Kitasatospora]